MKAQLLLLVATALTAGSATGDQKWNAGQDHELAWEAFEHPLQVFVPTDYQPNKPLPLMIYYHGTNGSPSTRQIQRFTRGKGYIILGMAYLESGRFQFTEANLQQEIDALGKVVKHLNGVLSIDPDRVFVAGFSKGGWIAGMFIERVDWLAGGMIMGAGIYDKQRRDSAPFSNPKWVYVGVGENDGNHGMSLRAKDHLTQLGAVVTLDVWAGLGHQAPNQDQLGSASHWLTIAKNGMLASRPQAVVWLRESLTRLPEEPFEAYLALQRLKQDAFVHTLNAAQQKTLTEALSELRLDPVVAEESKIEQALLKILAKERLNRYVQNLRECIVAYQKLHQENPSRHFGKLAGQHAKRAKKMLPAE